MKESIGNRGEKTHRNIKITNEIICDCAKQQTAARRTCHHVVRVFRIFSKWVIMTSCFHRLTSLKIINDGVRQYNQKLWDHEKLDLTQALFVSRNHTSRPQHCSVYLQPKKAMPGNLLFYVEGFLYLEKGDKVVEAKLRFCLATWCTTNIIRYLKNIKSLASTIWKIHH